LANERRKYWISGSLALFVVYIFIAARPIPQETIMLPQWLSSLESGYPVSVGNSQEGPSTDAVVIPFRLGDRFGYVDPTGHLPINRIKEQNLFLSSPFWAEYGEAPEEIQILDNTGQPAFRIDQGSGNNYSRGYPLYLDGRLFLVGKDMNTLTALDGGGKFLWSYDFAAPLTCIDAAAGFVLTGSLDGAVEILDRQGKRFFFFEPGGSRLSAIMGCSFSRDGNRLAVISGIDDQRFLLLERYGDPATGDFRVIYHEFLEDGFRRPVHISFIDNDTRVAFERQGGIGIYEMQNRVSRTLALEGAIIDMDTGTNNVSDATGNRLEREGIFFVITSQAGRQKKLVGIRLPGTIVLEAPFRSDDAFLSRSGSRIYLGGGSTLAAFELGKR
jgi:hypothetical protein